MVKAYKPLHSLDARGQFAQSIIFQGNRRGITAKQYARPQTAPTTAQTSHRSRFRLLSQAWSKLSAPDRATWDAIPRPQTESSYAAFTRYNWYRLNTGRLALAVYDPSAESLYDGMLIFCPLDEHTGETLHNAAYPLHATLLTSDPTAAWNTYPDVLTLNGIDDKIRFAGLNADCTQPHTVAIKLTVNAYPQYNGYTLALYKSDNTTQCGVANIYSTAIVRPWHQHNDDASVAYMQPSTPTISLSTPTLIIASYDGSNTGAGIRGWLNADEIQRESNFDGTGNPITPGYYAYIGGRPEDNTRQLAISIEWLAYWPRLLTPAERSQLLSRKPYPIRTE